MTRILESYSLTCLELCLSARSAGLVLLLEILGICGGVLVATGGFAISACLYSFVGCLFEALQLAGAYLLCYLLCLLALATL